MAVGGARAGDGVAEGGALFYHDIEHGGKVLGMGFAAFDGEYAVGTDGVVESAPVAAGTLVGAPLAGHGLSLGGKVAAEVGQQAGQLGNLAVDGCVELGLKPG